MQAMLLAAGFGTRLQPFTAIRPKPLFPILNRPLLFILLDMLRTAGSSRIVINCHHLAGQIEAALADREDLILQHEPRILGTGGSLRQALPHFSDQPVLVMNGDIFHSIDLAAVLEFHKGSGNLVTMVMHDFPRFNNVGVLQDRIVTFQPEPCRDEVRLLAYTGIQVVEPQVLERIPPHTFFHIIDLYRQLIRDGERIGCTRVDGAFWRDIGTPADYLELHGELLTGKIRQPLPIATGHASWCIAEQTSLPSGVTLEEWGCIGSNATIGAGARLARVVVWEDAVVPAGAQLEDVIVAPAVAQEMD